MICGGNEAVTGHGDAEGVRTERLYSMEAWQCVDRLTQWNCWHRRPLSDKNNPTFIYYLIRKRNSCIHLETINKRHQREYSQDSGYAGHADRHKTRENRGTQRYRYTRTVNIWCSRRLLKLKLLLSSCFIHILRLKFNLIFSFVLVVVPVTSSCCYCSRLKAHAAKHNGKPSWR